MNRTILKVLMGTAIWLWAGVSYSLAQVSTSQLIFNQLSTQFLPVNQNAVIPIGVNSMSSTDKVHITGIAGLPGATFQATSASGPNADGNIEWYPAVAGSYAAQITAEDDTTGVISTAVFTINVSQAAYNTSATFNPISTQSVDVNGMLVLGVSAGRPVAPNTLAGSLLSITASGLPGVTLQNKVSTTTETSANVVWYAPTTPGLYFLTLQVSDAYGAYTEEEVPVIVN